MRERKLREGLIRLKRWGRRRRNKGKIRGKERRQERRERELEGVLYIN